MLSGFQLILHFLLPIIISLLIYFQFFSHSEPMPYYKILLPFKLQTKQEWVVKLRWIPYLLQLRLSTPAQWLVWQTSWLTILRRWSLRYSYRHKWQKVDRFFKKFSKNSYSVKLIPKVDEIFIAVYCKRWCILAKMNNYSKYNNTYFDKVPDGKKI